MSAEDQPDYVSALHLHRLPFDSDSDRRFFFPDPVLTQRLDQLQHLAQFGGLVLVVEGEAGSGKTTFLNELVCQAGDTWNVCRIQSDPNFAPLEVVRQVARQFDLDDEGHPDELGRKIFDFCQVMSQTSQVPVIIVDDADRMPMEVLDQLLHIGGSPEETVRQIRVILFGTPGLQENLVKSGVCKDNSLIHSVIMHPFDEAQTDAYLIHRLSIAGFSGASPFSSMEVRAIHKSGSGLPSRINRLAHQTLMEHVWAIPRHAQMQGKGATMPSFSKIFSEKLSGEGKWLAAGVAAVLIAGILWLVGPEPETDDAYVAGDTVSEELMLPASDRPVPDSVAEDRVPVRAEPSEPVAEEPGPVVAEADVDAEATAPLLLPVPVRPEPAVSDAPKAGEETGEAAIPATPPASGGSVAAAMVEPHAGDGSRPAVAGAPAPESAQPAEPAEPPAAPVKESVAAPQVARAEPPAPVAPAAPASAGIHRESWLKQQSPGAVTLQVLGVSNEASLKRFLDQHKLPGPMAYFHTTRNGKPWFVLVHGVYPDRDAAKAAVAALPEVLRKGSPWPRTFESIQADIR